MSVGLWFKAAERDRDGVLFSYDADAITDSSGSRRTATPRCTSATNGELYGEFWNGSSTRSHTGTSVDDGNWHYAVLTGRQHQPVAVPGRRAGGTRCPARSTR